MNILTVSNCELRESLGSGYVVLNFCRGLQNGGHRVDVVGPDQFELLQGLRPHAKRYRQTVGMLFATLRLCWSRFYDVVEFYGGEAWLAISALARLKNRRFLIVHHTNGPEPRYEDIGSFKGRQWYQIDHVKHMTPAFTRVDGIVTVSEYDREWLVQRSWPRSSRVAAIELALPDDYLGQDCDLSRSPVIGFCGSWIERKGIDLIVTDVAAILRDFPSSRLILIGVGENFRKDRWFPAAVCDQIEIFPFVADKTHLKQIYHRISVFVLPSKGESFGLVLSEAMACGCAVVTTRCGFAANLVHGEEALILQDDSSPRLYQAVKTLIQDNSYRQQIARAGHKRVQHLKWSSAGKRLEETYAGWLREFRRQKG